MARVYEIDENTKLPAKIVWGLFAATVPVLFGAAVWATTVFVKLENAEAKIVSIESTVSDINEDRAKRREVVIQSINDLKVEIMELKTLIKAQNKGQ